MRLSLMEKAIRPRPVVFMSSALSMAGATCPSIWAKGRKNSKPAWKLKTSSPSLYGGHASHGPFRMPTTRQPLKRRRMWTECRLLLVRERIRRESEASRRRFVSDALGQKSLSSANPLAVGHVFINALLSAMLPDSLSRANHTVSRGQHSRRVLTLGISRSSQPNRLA